MSVAMGRAHLLNEDRGSLGATATFLIFLELSERIFSRLRRTFTGCIGKGETHRPG
jgi:hypothetical protein